MRQKTVHELGRQPVPMRLYIALKILNAHGSLTTVHANHVGNVTVACMLDKKPPTQKQTASLINLLRHYELTETYKELMAERNHKEFFVPGKDKP